MMRLTQIDLALARMDRCHLRQLVVEHEFRNGELFLSFQVIEDGARIVSSTILALEDVLLTAPRIRRLVKSLDELLGDAANAYR